MGNTITNWAQIQSAGSGGAKAVLLCLADKAPDYDKGKVSMTQQQIADIIEFDKRSVMRWLDKLEENALIERAKSKKSDGTNNPNLYQILCPVEIFTEKLSDTLSPSQESIVSESHQDEHPSDRVSLPNDVFLPETPDFALNIVTDSHLEPSDTESPSTVHEEEELKKENISQESYDSFDTAVPKPSKEKVSKIAKSSAKDPRSQHLAIQTVRGLMNAFPNKILWDTIIRKFGEDFNQNQLRLCREAWIERGYNPQATTWLNWYFDGIPEQITKNGANNGQLQKYSPNQLTAREKREQSAVTEHQAREQVRARVEQRRRDRQLS